MTKPINLFVLILITLIFVYFISLKNITYPDNHPKLDLTINEEYQSLYLDSYEHIRNDISDSLSQWINDTILSVKPLIFSKKWSVNKTIILNEDSSRFITTILDPGIRPDTETDWIYGFTGHKVDDKWYYYWGGNYLIGRESYIADTKKSLTNNQLSFISYKSPLYGMLTRNKNNKIVIDYDKVEKKIKGGWVSCKMDNDCINRKIETAHLKMLNRKVEKKEYLSIIESIKNAKKQEKAVPIQQDGKLPFFETSVWQNRFRNSFEETIINYF